MTHIRNNDDTRKLVKWLGGDSQPSDANGSQGFPQALGGDWFECLVPRPNGSHIKANLFRPTAVA